MAAPAFPDLALLLLGAWHGINPAMGWLFAVALGLQERRSGAVWRALPPLALGHGLAIAGAVALAGAAGLVVPIGALKWIVAAVLLGLGLAKLRRSRHPRYGGMLVGFRDLTIWSLLMASAHGAGLMVLPFVLQDASSAAVGGHLQHAAASLAGTFPGAGLGALVLHTTGYLLVTGLVAVVVYEKLGLRRLQAFWLNLDLLWAVALIATAIATPLI